MRSLQKFASVHASIYSLFNLERSLNSRSNFKLNRAAALTEWRGLCSTLGTATLSLDADGAVVLQKKLRRGAVLDFLGKLDPCQIGMEACATSHYRAREIAALGHDVRLIPPAYVKPYVKRQKNDAADAEAICEAVTRPNMRFVPVKTEEQQGVLWPQITQTLSAASRRPRAPACRSGW